MQVISRQNPRSFEIVVLLMTSTLRGSSWGQALGRSSANRTLADLDWGIIADQYSALQLLGQSSGQVVGRQNFRSFGLLRYR